MTGKRRFLFVGPEAVVLPHFTAMLVLARSLQDIGHEVAVAACHQAVERCISKESVSVKAGQTHQPGLCNRCSSTASQTIAFYGLRNVWNMHHNITPELREQVRRDIEAWNGPLTDYTLDDVNFGRLALYETLFTFKLLSAVDLSDEAKQYLGEQLRSIVAVYRALLHLVAVNKITDVVVYGQYGINLGACMAAQKRGAKWHVIQQVAHLAVDRRRIMVQQGGSSRKMIHNVHRFWPLWQDIPLPPDSVREIISDNLSRMASRSIFTYSPAKTHVSDIRADLGLAKDRPLLVAFTASPDERVGSDDVGDILGEERLASAKNLFPSQAEWLRGLIGWMETRPDLQLVVRIHPREDANRRDGVRSAHFTILQQALARVPDNVKVVWPGESVSSYDLMEAAAVVLTSWSNIGLESARLGVPVLTYEEETGTYPVGDFITGAESWDDYVAAIDRILSEPTDLMKLKRAVRYYGLRVMGNSLYLGDVIPQKDQQGLTAYRTPERLADIEQVLCGGVSCPEYYLAEAKARRGDAEAEWAETRTLLSCFQQMSLYFLTGELPKQAFSWHVIEVGTSEELAALSRSSTEAPLLAVAREECRYVNGETDVTRWSPLVARLARLSRVAVLSSNFKKEA